jgi:hypothetical protein
MALIARYLTIPVLFSLLVACYAMVTGKQNQAEWLGLFLYGVLFYGAPFFVLAFFAWLLKASNNIVHAGFIGVSLSLLLIAGLWLLPPDPSGLPIQWMGYWPLSAVLGLVLVGGSFVLAKHKDS